MKFTGNDLKNQIIKGNIENIYLFAGTEIGDKKEMIELIQKKIFGNDKPVKYVFYCDSEFDSAEFLNSLKTGLLFSEKKIIIVKNIEDINKKTIEDITYYLIPKILEESHFVKNILDKIKKEDEKKELLKIYKKEKNFYSIHKKLTGNDKKNLIKLFHSIDFKNHDPETYLIMLNETKEKIPEDLINLLLPQQYIIFWEMFENQKFIWVREQFKKNNLYIEDDAISFILDTIENNKDQLKNEIEKITILFKQSFPKKNVLKKFFIEEYLCHSKIETPFSLYSTMLEGNLSKSISILDNLFLEDENGLLNGLIWSHRRFLMALDLYENQKKSINEIFSILKITAKKNKDDFTKGFNRYNFNHACLMFYYLSELDYYLKILPANLKLVKLQEFIINFINGDIRKSFLQGNIEITAY